MIEKLEQYRTHVLGFMAIIYAVGVVGLSTEEFHSAFIDLTPLNLCLTACIMIAYTHRKSKILLWCLFAFVIGFGVEVAGVQTGVIFGEYKYSSVLGVHLFDTPLLIGVNWLLLSYGAAKIVSDLRLHALLKSLVGALMLVGLDVLIEPVAIELNFWSWAGNSIPLQNYLAWGIVAFIIQAVYHFYVKESKNKIVSGLFLIQILFFSILNIVL